MRTPFENLLAVMAVASAIFFLGYTAVAPRALIKASDDIPAYAQAI
jgi:hypothetical protein